MKRDEKEAVVVEMAEKVARAKAVLLTHFRGLKVEKMTELRAQLRAKGLDYVVVKNRLMKRAIAGTSAEVMGDILKGPNGFGLAYQDPVDLAKVLVDFAKANQALELRGGCLEGRLIKAEDIAALAKLPPREIILAQLLGAMNGVPRNLVSVLAAVPRGLVIALKAIADQKPRRNRPPRPAEREPTRAGKACSGNLERNSLSWPISPRLT